MAPTVNLLKLRGILLTLTRGRRIWFWYVAVAVGVTLPAQIHRSNVAYQAIYGRSEAMAKAAREADLAPKPGEWLSQFCRREYQYFSPGALQNPAFDPICKRQLKALLAHCKQEANGRSAWWDEQTGNPLHHPDSACDL
jgi:hypothetical protein